jgi:hypothetical protein
MFEMKHVQLSPFLCQISIKFSRKYGTLILNAILLARRDLGGSALVVLVPPLLLGFSLIPLLF